MENPFRIFAVKFYQILKPIIFKRRNQKVIKDLIQLSPSANVEKLYDGYLIKKISAVLSFLVIGIVFAVLFHVSSQMEGNLVEGMQVKRNEWGEGDYTIKLQAVTKDWKRDIPLFIEERKLTEKEINLLLKNLQTELPEIIKKDNQDLQNIISDLYLPSFVSGYPFQIRWESSDDEKISSSGKVERSLTTKDREQIMLTAILTYEGEKADFSYDVWVLPKDFKEEDEFFWLLENELNAAEENEKQSTFINLPVSLYGKEIEWKEVKSEGNIVFIWAAVLGSIMICRGMDRDLKKSCEKRRKQLLADYSGFVSKLQLYLSAGLTVKNAFIRIRNDYDKKKSSKSKNYLYEEMKRSCYQLENGMMEEKVYQEFGRRCEEKRYKKLAFLLSVHLKQGNSQLLKLLEEEADSALEDRRQFAKRAGEEAGTKLLFPMMLMMLVVMALILLPAYFNFGDI